MKFQLFVGAKHSFPTQLRPIWFLIKRWQAQEKYKVFGFIQPNNYSKENRRLFYEEIYHFNIFLL